MTIERTTIKSLAAVVGILTAAGALLSLADPRVPLWFGAVAGAGVGLLVIAIGSLALLGGERWRKIR